MGTGIEGEDISDKRLAFSLPSNHIGDLDYGVDVGFREDTLSPSTFDVETENSEWCNVGAITFR